MGEYERNYGGVIWTKHALERLEQRGIKQGDAWSVWRSPDQSRFAASKGAWVYYKTWGNDRIEVVAKQNEKKQWIILSVWSKPILNKKGKKKTKGDYEPIWKSVIKAILGK